MVIFAPLEKPHGSKWVRFVFAGGAVEPNVFTWNLPGIAQFNVMFMFNV